MRKAETLLWLVAVVVIFVVMRLWFMQAQHGH